MTTALRTVQQIYAAFSRGDIPAILDCLDDEEMHLWNVNAQGKIVRFRHYLDTDKHIALLPH